MKQIAMALILMVSVLQGATIRVPQDQATIQAGINAAVDGDTVLVGPGVYTENIMVPRSLVLLGVPGPSGTVVTPLNSSQHTLEAVSVSIEIRGFSFTGSNSDVAVLLQQCHSRLSNNRVFGNNCTTAPLEAYGVNTQIASTCIVDSCDFFDNHGGNQSAGLLLIELGGPNLVKESLFHNNSGNNGGGITLWGANNTTISRCLIYDCTVARHGSGIALVNSSTNDRIVNNTIVSCVSIDGFGALMLYDNSNNVGMNNNVVGCTGGGIREGIYSFNNSFGNSVFDYSGGINGGGNISADPLFGALPYQLSQLSPCINAGNPDPIYNDPDGSRNDMGAFPFISPNTRKDVPQEYPTIQAAIDAAVDGDTVLVDDGHYFERISFLGKKIIVTSKYLIDSDTLHIYQTIIDGDTAFVPLVNDTGSVVRFVNNEDSTSILTGLTITNGVGTGGQGGGVYCENSGPKLLSNRITNNGSNSGMRLRSFAEPGAIVESCWVFGNLGSGVRCMYSGLYESRYSSIVGNSNDGILCKNSAIMSVIGGSISYNGGDGVGLSYGTYRIIRDCLIESNGGSGIGLGTSKLLSPDAKPATNAMEPEGPAFRYLVNCLIRGNDRGISFANDATWTVDSCLIEENQIGAIGLMADVHLVLQNSIIRNNGNLGVIGGGIRFIGDQFVGIECYNTIFEGNMADKGGAIAETINCPYTIASCTFVNNYANQGSAIYQSYKVRQNAIIEMCTFSANTGGPVIVRSLSPDTSLWGDTLKMEFSCTNIFGNEGGDWIDSLAPQFGVNGNISANPLFCDTASGDYRIKDSSPCAPANNSCGVLIGAYGIGCANVAPVLTSGNSAQAVSGLGFVYKATSTDVDGPATTYSFINLPSWLTANGDSAFGTPPLTDIDTSFMVIVSDGFLADSMIVTLEITESPVISALTTESVAVAMNVISHTPIFGWQYFDATGSYPQTQFEIAVGSDSDWTYSELWNPAPFSGAATSKQYAGAALLDGQTYWVRARVRNALIWSNWKQTSFRMNSVPGVPGQRLPVDNSIVNTEHPTLVVRNPSDAENDSMVITFELSADSFATSIFPIQVKASSDSLTSFWVNFPLNEDLRFWWRVKASDYYEESGYSQVRSFWINSVNSTPTAFSLLSPPNGSSPALPGNLPEFTWENSLDIDPGDSVEFTLQLAIDPSFSFLSQISGLTSPHYLTATPLEWGRRYWWRVKAEDKSTGVRWSNETFDFKIMALGDADGSGTVTISDVVFLINYIFGGGPAPNPIESGDADCSGAVTISDVVYLINYIFAGTAAPCEG